MTIGMISRDMRLVSGVGVCNSQTLGYSRNIPLSLPDNPSMPNSSAPWCFTLHSCMQSEGHSQFFRVQTCCHDNTSRCDLNRLKISENNISIRIRIMGRLSTAVASVGVDADNLPEKIPNISLIDALLPASWSSRSSKKDKVRNITQSHANGNTSFLKRKLCLPTSKTHESSNLTSSHFSTTSAIHSTSTPTRPHNALHHPTLLPQTLQALRNRR
jgi:hypothetical protein